MFVAHSRRPTDGRPYVLGRRADVHVIHQVSVWIRVLPMYVYTQGNMQDFGAFGALLTFVPRVCVYACPYRNVCVCMYLCLYRTAKHSWDHSWDVC